METLLSEPRRKLHSAIHHKPWRKLLLAIAIPIIIGGFLYAWIEHSYRADRPVEYDSLDEHFKYGSIAADRTQGIPLAVFKTLPVIFPEHLPMGYEGPLDYRAFGFHYEPNRDVPIGFSVRRHQGIDKTGLNCAACHVGQWRLDPGDPPRLYPGGTSNTVNIEEFFRFLFACAEDERFTADYILEAVEKVESLFVANRLLLRLAIPQLRSELLRQRVRLSYIYDPKYPGWGHGSVDTFNPYKVLQFAASYPGGIPEDEKVVMADYPVIWQQAKKNGIYLHWDGTNSDTRERNRSAAFGAGATREDLLQDLEEGGLKRMADWLDPLPPPPFIAADEIDNSLAERGRSIYRKYCFDCHDFDGRYVGQVVPLDVIGTDPARWKSFTSDFIRAQGAYLAGKKYDPLRFKHFRKTNGYVNMPLDGVWTRAPYLHNGAVPTLWDLLLPPDQRPKKFYRGHGVYDGKKVGIRTDVTKLDGRPAYLHDTTLYSKGNQGHDYGTSLPDEHKWALVEYLKTL